MVSWLSSKIRLVEPSQSEYMPLLAVSSSTKEAEGRDGAKGATITDWIKDNVPSLRGRYKPTWWLPNGHLQTAFVVGEEFTSRDKVEYTRTLLRVPDGGTIGLDFTPPSHHTLAPTTPTIVICHGITGGSHESYVRNLLMRVIRPVRDGGLGCRAVVLISRGCAGVPLTSDQLYSAGTTIDLSITLHYLRSIYPESPLHGIGFSLGASALMGYLGDTCHSSLLSSGIVLGVPNGLPCMSVRLNTHWFYSRMYSRRIAANQLNLFHQQYAENAVLWDKSERIAREDLQRLLKLPKGKAKLKTVDDLLISKVGGPQGEGMWPFDTAEEYYWFSSPHRVLHKVKRPVLWIAAMDDPVLDSKCVPIDEVRSSSHVVMALTARGGHLGWFTGSKAKERWITRPVTEFLSAAFEDCLLVGPDVEIAKGSSTGPPQENNGRACWSSIMRDKGKEDSFIDRDENVHGWKWVKTPAHHVQGVTDGRLGWKVLQSGKAVHGQGQGEGMTSSGL